MLQGQCLVIFLGDAGTIVLNLDGIQPLVLETHLYQNPVSQAPVVAVPGPFLLTNRGGAGIHTIFNQLFRNGAEVNDDLTRLDLVDRTSLDGLDSCHGSPWAGEGAWRRLVMGTYTQVPRYTKSAVQAEPRSAV